MLPVGILIMSIAVSTVVYPSRLLLALKIGISLFVALIGIVVALRGVGNLDPGPAMVLAGACIAMACIAFFRAVTDRSPLHIDISGTGQIRITENLHLPSPLDEKSSELVQLMPGSTLWQYLLLLQLESKERGVRIVPVLPDSVGADGFRALSVACQWIAAHNVPGERENL